MGRNKIKKEHETEQEAEIEEFDKIEDGSANVTGADEEAMSQENEEKTTDYVVTLNQIAKPLADDKLAKRLMKLIKKSSAKKDKLKRGLRNVQVAIRKGSTGICLLAGDVTPIDMYIHLPVVCEDKNIPYCFVPSKKELGAAFGAKRPCIAALVCKDDAYEDLFDKCHIKVSSMSC